MAETNNDLNHAVLNLTPQEKTAYSHLFSLADKDSLGVVTGENAVSFFERTKLSPEVLGEIWQIADTENRGLLTKPGFCIVLRLIGHTQAGSAPSKELAFKPAPLPKFEGMSYPSGVGSGGSVSGSPTTGSFPPGALQPQLSGQGPIRVPPLDPTKAQQYSGLFERSGAQNGLLDGATAKSIFERAGLPNETLGRIWGLADREQRGALNQTEFIIAMHLLTSMKMRAMPGLPSNLPAGLYEAAARRGAAPPPGARQPPGRTGVPGSYTGSGVGPPRTSSPLASRPVGFGTPPPVSAQSTGPQWLISPGEKAKYDQFFNNIDKGGRGFVTGEQAVTFFSDSGLSEDTLASIWDLADINSEGQLTKDEFAVAMFLIKQQRMQNPAPLPAFLPPALVPPSMRKQYPAQPPPVASQPSTAPAFDNANNTSNLPKSAADDLFGLDEPAQSSQSSQPALQPQGTGASGSGATKDPFSSSSPASPSTPQRFQPQSQQSGVSTMFKPFVPSSAFGASLQAQHTGGSQGSASGQARNFSAPVQPPFNHSVPQHFGFQQQPQQAGPGGDDLLGDSDANAAESAKMTNETTELANMSNQIGNLRGQMESTQSKKQATQADLDRTNSQKRDLELRLQQFRTQYETEVRTVKELETQLATSKDSSKKLTQELAMLEGSYQDLSTQHQSLATQLAQDQQENASLKQRITQLNAEVGRLKPEIEKLQMDARKERGMVSINKKQVSTNEGERDRLQSDKEGLEKVIAERDAAVVPGDDEATPVNRSVATSPSGMGSMNPFFRKTSTEAPAAERSVSPTTAMANAPLPSAFDTLFGPAFGAQVGSGSGTPPATSFVGRSVAPASVSTASAGFATPDATPPVSEHNTGNLPPPPPPESRQFTPSVLGTMGANQDSRSQSVASSTRVMPPASRAGGVETPLAPGSRGQSPAPSSAEQPAAFTAPAPPAAETERTVERVPGAFPDEAEPSQSSAPPVTNNKEDFDSAFASFDDADKSKDASADDVFAPAAESAKPKPGGFANEFPPIQNLEHEEDSDSDDDDETPAAKSGFEDNFTQASPPQKNTEQPQAESVSSGADIAAIAGHGSPEPVDDPGFVATRQMERRRSIQESEIRPSIQHMQSNDSALPTVEAQQSPPAYEQGATKDKVQAPGRSDSNQFPAEYGGLLPSRDDPTSPPPATSPPTNLAAATGSQLNPSGPEEENSAPSQPPASKNAFDDFDEFDDLSEAKEDKGGSDFDFGFNHSRGESTEFSPAFDSPAASMTNTIASAASQQTPRGSESINGIGNAPTFASSTMASGHSSLQQTPQNAQHDWDAIFSGLDNSKNIDTTFSGDAKNDPWGEISTAPATNGDASAAAAAAADTPKAMSPPATGPSVKQQAAAQIGRAITPGTEHDDPILKRLTGMGYARADALNALEKYDYDINRAVDSLTSK